jgi:F0F1-type ATP synthase alpha subunit
MSDLIPTNVMACTDGHLSFLPSLRAEGIYPSISIEQSVTRVGRQSQRTLQKQVTRHMQMLLGSYRTQLEYAKFSADLSDQTKEILRRGGIAEVLLQQPAYEGGRSLETQVILLGLVFSGFFAIESAENVGAQRTKIVTMISTAPELAPLRIMALDDTTNWETFLATLTRYHAVMQTYVSST